MSGLEFLAEWAVRSSAAVVGALFLLRLLRVQASSIRLTLWTATLVVSLSIPALTAMLPGVSVAARWPTRHRFVVPEAIASLTGSEEPPRESTAASIPAVSGRSRSVAGEAEGRPDVAGGIPGRVRFATAAAALAFVVYVLGAGAFGLRIITGLAMSRRLRSASTVALPSSGGFEVRESELVTTPVTVGIVRPAIVLPADWREWDRHMLDAVLAHERSHGSRRDTAWQLLSLIHRALLWFSPLSWFLHRRMVREAEAASDDAAIAATGDRASYAAVLLHFMQRGMQPSALLAVPMARYGDAAGRIDGILDAASVSRRARTWSAVAVTAIGLPLGYLVVAAQARPEFEIAAISPSAHDASRGGHLQLEGGAVRAGRYEVRRATILDLITLAYGVRRDAVSGGPSRLDWDRFDVAAKVPPNTRPDTVKLMLQSLLADRFKLVARVDTRPAPAWVLSRGTGPLRLRRGKGSAEAGCIMAPDRDGVSCRGVTMDAYVEGLRSAALTNRAVVNSTGLEGAWDFDLRYTTQQAYGIPDISSGDTGIFNALKEVGLDLALRDVAQPVVAIESANEQPTANAPGVEVALPPAPAEFEVASIRPCTPPQGIMVRASPGGLVNTGCTTLEMLIKRAWNLEFRVQFAPQLVLPFGNREAIPGLPERLGERSFQITARSPFEFAGMFDANLLAMMRNLLLDRFKMAVRYEDRPRDVHALVAVRPQLQPADPSARSECRQSIAPQQDVRAQLLTCRNVTMAQFAERLGGTYPLVASASQGRVVDETGMSGAWNFTLTWADAPFGVRSSVIADAAPDAARAAADPAGGITLFDAVEKQLGLKLERREKPVPVLVIDRIAADPVEN